MASDITFSLLNFASADDKSSNNKPSEKKFSKLSSSKKQVCSSSKKENSSSKNVAKNLLSSYNEKGTKNSTSSVLKERKNFFDNKSNFGSHINQEPLQNVFNKLYEPIKSSKEKETDPALKCPKFSSYQKIIEHSKKMFLEKKENGGTQISSTRSHSYSLLEKVQIRNLNSVAEKKDENILTRLSLRSRNDDSLDKVKKSDSLSTSYSSLESSVPKVTCKNKNVAQKCSETVVSLSSPETNDTLYESITSFFTAKSGKSSYKSLVSSTPRCSEVFHSHINVSEGFESAISRVSPNLSKCSLNTSSIKNNSSINAELKTDSKLFVQKSSDTFDDGRSEKFDALLNTSNQKITNSKSSIDKIVATSTSDQNSSKLNLDKFDALINSSSRTSCNLKNSTNDNFNALKNSSDSKNSVENSPFSNETHSFKKSTNKKIDRLKNGNSDNLKKSTDEIFDSLRKSYEKSNTFLKNESAKNSLQQNNQLQSSSNDSSGRRFKETDERRVMVDTLKLKGVTIRRHRRQKVLGVQKDFMYEETSSDSSEEEADGNDIDCADVEPEPKKPEKNISSLKTTDDSLSPIIRKLKSKRLLESSKSSSDDSASSILGAAKKSSDESQSCESASGLEVSNSESLFEAEKLLNELYGSTWHDKKNVILTKSSVKKKVSKEKPKEKSHVCQAIQFSSDEENYNGKGSKKRKQLRKKKQSSFINDDSSLSEAEDLNLHRTYSNKLLLSDSKPKSKNPTKIFSSSSEDLVNKIVKEIDKIVSSTRKTKGSIDRKSKSLTYVSKKSVIKTPILIDKKLKKPSLKTPKVAVDNPQIIVISSDSDSSDSDSSEKGSKKTVLKKSVKKITNTPLKPNLKKLKINTPAKARGKDSEKLSFLASLSATADESRIHPDAVPYKKFYKGKKEELARRLLILYNKEVFDSKLPDDMLLQWNARMRSTSGYCYNKKVRRTGIEMARVSRIVLSSKILDTPDRLRDTLIHELCHSAAWIINGTSDGHGPIWKSWAYKAMRRFPEIPPIKRCHDYSIKTKFTYRCTSCGYSIGRHSKSLDITRKRCGYCYGAFELLVNHARSNRKSAENLKTPRAPGKFALFVKENYNEVKKSNTQLKNAEIMKILGQRFKDSQGKN